MDIWWGRRTASVVGAVLLTVGAVVGGQLALGAALGGSDPSAEGVARTALSPYRDGAFTVRAAAVDRRVGIQSAQDGSYVLGHAPAGNDVILDLGLLDGASARPWWVEPATGRTLELAELASEGIARFPAPDAEYWVLVIDDAAAGYGAPDADTIAELVRSVTDEPGTADSSGGGDPSRLDGAPAAGAEQERSAPDQDRPGSTERSDGGEQERENGGDGSPDGDRDDRDSGTGDGKDGGSAGRGSASGNAGTADRPETSDHLGPSSGTDPADRTFTGEQEKPSTQEARPEETAQPPTPAPPPAPGKEPAPRPESEPKVAADASWDRLAQCESSGDWAISTGNGYYGGLQFDEPTWREFGGGRFAPTADGASKDQQIEIATKVRDTRGGYGSWPACARELGLPR